MNKYRAVEKDNGLFYVQYFSKSWEDVGDSYKFKDMAINMAKFYNDPPKQNYPRVTKVIYP